MSAVPRYPGDMGYNGLRMTADEYLALGETAERYELIDGVVVMAPSPVPDHNEIAAEVIYQLQAHARGHAGMRVLPETDLRLPSNKVYRPDICVYRTDRLRGKVAHLVLPPDLIVEVLSPGTKPLDLITKRDDYESFGVGEYWAIDPADARVRCWRRSGPRLLDTPPEGDRVECRTIPGFVLDIGPIRAIVNRA